MSIQQIVTLLEFCLKNTYFLFQGKFYEQVQGAAMGSSISTLIANLFMEEFEVKALSSCPHPPTLWLRFVDDTFVIPKAEQSKPLLQHINKQHPHIQFAVGEPSQQGTLPFLDTLVTIECNNTFTTSVYRKPTHTDQFLHWDSNHFITAKQSVYNTLAHRAKIDSLTKKHWTKNVYTLGGPYRHVNFQTRHVTNSNTSSKETTNPAKTTITTATLQTTTTQTAITGTSPL